LGTDPGTTKGNKRTTIMLNIKEILGTEDDDEGTTEKEGEAQRVVYRQKGTDRGVDTINRETKRGRKETPCEIENDTVLSRPIEIVT